MDHVNVNGVTYITPPETITLCGLTYRLEKTTPAPAPAMDEPVRKHRTDTKQKNRPLPAGANSADYITVRDFLNGRDIHESRDLMTFGRMARNLYVKVNGVTPYYKRVNGSEIVVYTIDDLPCLELAFAKFQHVKTAKGGK